MISAVIFDMDGVLLDSEPYHDQTTTSILESYGAKGAYEAIRPFVGRSPEDMWAAMKIKYDIPASVEDLVELQWKKNVSGLSDSGLERSEGLSELLEFCHKKGIRVAVASSSRQDFMEAVFDHLDLWKYVEVFASGSEVENGKPMPDIFLLAATRLDVDPERCLVVEDSTAGVQAGRMAGMYTIGYDNPTSGGQNVNAADVVVKSLGEIPKIIEQLSEVKILPVTSPTRKMAVVSLAQIIWNEWFPSIISQEQVNYMVDKFQSMPAIDKAIEEEGYQYFLEVLGDTPIGYMGVKEQEDALLLSKLYLMKPFRGQRRSNVFFDKAEEIAREKGKDKVRLFVNRYNYNSIRVYLRRGYRIMKEEKTDIGGGFICDDYVMEKEL
ncbi:MAG: HAD-IA family hydrolase [Clostridiales bacterium]|nr:HAD-IA family hydrolase [Clostridiales bacterium]MBR4819556.1 HAD-IA family hydrolase [Clostridiales bacterium]MBR5039926.1 HAD-IA family hydrolase [Clostridiales bacterium]MBR5058723.1 HAD-IA family hydrolase [Clostridiales bacterium]